MPRCRKCQPVPEEVRRAADLLERRWLLSVLFAAMSGKKISKKDKTDQLEMVGLADRMHDKVKTGIGK